MQTYKLELPEDDALALFALLDTMPRCDVLSIISNSGLSRADMETARQGSMFGAYEQLRRQLARH